MAVVQIVQMQGIMPTMEWGVAMTTTTMITMMMLIMAMLLLQLMVGNPCILRFRLLPQAPPPFTAGAALVVEAGAAGVVERGGGTGEAVVGVAAVAAGQERRGMEAVAAATPRATRAARATTLMVHHFGERSLAGAHLKEEEEVEGLGGAVVAEASAHQTKGLLRGTQRQSSHQSTPAATGEVDEHTRLLAVK